FKFSADQLKRHKKVFSGWINLQLAKVKPPAKVTDLTRDLRDGQILLTLMEVLFGIKVTRAEPTSKRINQIKNVEEAMSILLQNNICKPDSDIVTTKGYRKATTLIKPFGVIPSEITAGDEKAILSLLWQIIRWRQITEVIKPDPMDYDEDKKLITWCQERIKGNSNVQISNLTTDWKDGLAFNILLHSFNPSLFDLDTISSKDEMSRRAHAINLATTEYGVPAIFDPEDFDKDTADKNLITLFLSYLYQFAAKGSSVTIVEKEVISPFETSLMAEEYGFKTISTRHETSRLVNTTVDFKTITQAGEKDQDDVFHDFKLGKESGQKTLLYPSAFPQGVSVEQRRPFVVSPFPRQSGGSSRASSGASSPISKDSDPKELELEIHKLARPLDTLGEGSYSYTVTQTRRIVTNGSDRSSSTTAYKTLQSSAADSSTVIKVTNTDKGTDILSGRGSKTDTKVTESSVKDTVITNNRTDQYPDVFSWEKETGGSIRTTVHARRETMDKKINEKEKENVGKTINDPEKKVPNLTLSTTDTGAGSYAYSVTQTRKIITSSGERVHSTTSNK
ncbi:unnamed protein product, partial [Porites evermanni]